MNCLAGLNAIHSRNPALVHRDIEPENILLSPSGAKLADFGLAKNVKVPSDQVPSEADRDQEIGSQMARDAKKISISGDDNEGQGRSYGSWYRE